MQASNAPTPQQPNQETVKGFYRINRLVNNPKKNYRGILDVSRSTFLSRVKDGTFPPGVRIGKRCIAWKIEDIEDLMARLGESCITSGHDA